MKSLSLKEIFAAARLFIQNRIFLKLRRPAPARLRLLYIGGYWRGPNDMVAQMLQGLRLTGADVVDFNTDQNQDALETDGVPYDMGTSGPVWLKWDRLLPLILTLRPHAVICNAGGLSFRPRDAARLRRLGVRLLGIALSDPAVYAPTTSKIAQNFDVFYSKDVECVEAYRRQGVTAYQLPTATNHVFFRPVPPREEYRCEVLILGALHADRVEPVRALVRDFDTHVYGENWDQAGVPSRGFVFGEDTLVALNSTRMSIIFSRQVSGHQALKVGIFDFLAAGCLVLTDENPQLAKYFEVGREIVTFADTDDLLRKVRYYLDHPEEAEAIRRAGHEKVVGHYTWDKVWPAILTNLFK